MFSNCTSVRSATCGGEWGRRSRGSGLGEPQRCAQVPRLRVGDGAGRQRPLRGRAFTGRPLLHGPTRRPRSRLPGARIHANKLHVGHQQTGVLLVNVDGSRLTDNLVRAGSRPADGVLMQDVEYRASLRRRLISHAVAGGGADGIPENTNATSDVQRPDHPLPDRQRPHPPQPERHVAATAINALNPPNISSPRLLERFLVALATDVVRTPGHRAGGSPTFANAITVLLAQAGHGGGRAGIRARRSARCGCPGDGQHRARCDQRNPCGPRPGGRDRLHGRRPHPEGNTIRMSLPTNATRDRATASLSASANSLVIERHAISVVEGGTQRNLRTEGMRIFGTMGRRVIVRHKSTWAPQFAVGITFAPLNLPIPAQPLWIVTEEWDGVGDREGRCARQAAWSARGHRSRHRPPAHTGPQRYLLAEPPHPQR